MLFKCKMESKFHLINLSDEGMVQGIAETVDILGSCSSAKN